MENPQRTAPDFIDHKQKMTFDIVSKFCIKMFSALYYILKEAQAHLSRQKKNNTEYIVVCNYSKGQLMSIGHPKNKQKRIDPNNTMTHQVKLFSFVFWKN